MTDKTIAVTGSPNTITEVAIDIREEYLSIPLLGTLAQFGLECKTLDGRTEDILVLGQVSDLKTVNRWHEDPAMKNYIKLHGRLPNLTEIGDVTTARMQVIGAYRKGDDGAYQKARMATPSGSGIPVIPVRRDTVEKIMSAERDAIAFLGTFYGSSGVPAPVYVRHFGSFDEGGSGEAYMGGVFGPSGSGKSVIAATLDTLWARNPEMGFLFLDPQSEFAGNRFAAGTSFSFDFHSMLVAATNGAFNPDRDILSIDRIRLSGARMFADFLVKRGLMSRLGVGAGKVVDATENLEGCLDSMKEARRNGGHLWQEDVSLRDLRDRDEERYQQIRAEVIRAISLAYASSTRAGKADEFNESWEHNEEAVLDLWDEVRAFFVDRGGDGVERTDLVSLVRDVMCRGRKVIVDLDPAHLDMGDDFKLSIMEFVFRKIANAAHMMYKGGGRANCMIVLDEAGRFIPQSTDDPARKRVGKYITAKVRELRKYSVGFQFITQNLTEIDKDIYRNLHYRIYGVGMAIGADAKHVEDREGKEAFEMYRSLPDPRLSGIFSYMVAGTLVALGTTGKPMYIEGFGSGQDVLRENGIIGGDRASPSGIPASPGEMEDDLLPGEVVAPPSEI